MSSIKTAYIYLDSIFQGGEPCKNPTIRWESNSCLNITCVLEDNVIKVNYTEDCEDLCFDIYIKCDDCFDCPEHHLRRCICDPIEGCPDPCDICIGDICTPIDCPKFCNNGDCVDCINDNHCPCNQVCLPNGECGCEDPTSYIDEKGCCVECLTSDHCEGCDQCIGKECVPLVCGQDLFLHLGTCSCRECLNDGHCTGPNECCDQEGRCKCCPGFIRNELGECVEAPECIGDDCPPGYECKEDKCEEIDCPPNTIYIPEFDDCMPICDCELKNCSGNKICIDYTTDLCICVDKDILCSGPCDGDCDPKYCDCDEDNNCIVKDDPENGGPGGGNDDPVDNPCDTDLCNNPDDCGDNCGCQEFNCVECSELSCETDECDNTPGCKCNEFNDCVKDTDPPQEGCTDIFTITKDDETCSLIVDLETDECCLCDKLYMFGQVTTLENSPANNFTKVELNGVLFKNGLSLDDIPLLPPSDRFPLLGIFRTTMRETFIRMVPNSDGVTFTPDFQTTVIRTTTDNTSVSGGYELNVDFENAATKGSIYTGSDLGIGNANHHYRIIARKIEIETITTVEFTNDCKYERSKVLVFSQNVAALPDVLPQVRNFNTEITRQGVVCKKPLIKIRKASSVLGLSSTNSEVFASYADPIGPNNYRLIIGPEVDIEGSFDSKVVEFGHYYAATTKCSCDPVAFYNCNNPFANVPQRLVFCNPTSFQYDITNCGKTLVINRDIETTCPVYLHPSSAKPVYQLLINGQVVFTSNPATIPVIIPSGSSFEMDEIITTIQLKIVNDPCDNCGNCRVCYTEQNPGLDATFNIDQNCLNLSPNANITITGGEGPYTVLINRRNAPGGTPTVVLDEVIPSPGNITVPLYSTSSGIKYYELIVTDDNGCEVIRTLTFNHNSADVSSLVNVEFNCDGGQGQVVITNNSNQNLEVTSNTLSLFGVSILANSTNTFNTFLSNQNATLAFIIPGSPECSFNKVVALGSCCTDAIGNLFYSCTEGLQGGVRFTGIAPGATAQIISPANKAGVITQGTKLDPGAYTVQINNPDGCSYTVFMSVPPCYQCVSNNCITHPQTLVNEGFSNLIACEQSGCSGAATPCDKCFDLFINAKSSNLSLRINGTDYTLNGPYTVVCSSNGQPLVVGNLIQDIETLLDSLEACGTSRFVSIVGVGIPYNDGGVPNPNDCFDQEVQDPTDCWWIKLRIGFTSLAIDGIIVDDGTPCLMPASQITCLV